MVSLGTIKSLVLFFGPMLLPKAITYYRSIRAGPVNGKPIRHVPAKVHRALTILFTVAVVALISTLPFFSPENIFITTQSRLQIPTDVLFTRLSSSLLRPHGLTENDTALRQKFASAESRLLYFKYGPDALINCLFCKADEPSDYLYYALTSILIPHLFNLCVLGLVTSGLFVGTEGTIWRRTATIAGIAVAATDLYMVSSYNHQENSRALRLEDLDMFFWKMRVYRSIAIAGMDAIFGWALYLSSTNRMFVTPLSASERIENVSRNLEGVRSKMGAVGVMRNTIVRDADLRTRTNNYWIEEGRITAEAMDDREVLDSVKGALSSGRIKVDDISRDADSYAKNLLSTMDPDGPS